MKTETALTAFCMTTVMLIVGLVLLTANDLQLTSAPLTGEYAIGLPTQGKVSREAVQVNFVKVDPKDPFCYQNGVKECRRRNAGQNFVLCSDRVAQDCGRSFAQLTQCFLPAGFELKYLTKRECDYGIIDECKVRCSAGTLKGCVDVSRGRCSLIGGRFQPVYQQTKYTAYPGR